MMRTRCIVLFHRLTLHGLQSMYIPVDELLAHNLRGLSLQPQLVRDPQQDLVAGKAALGHGGRRPRVIARVALDRRRPPEPKCLGKLKRMEKKIHQWGAVL